MKNLEHVLDLTRRHNAYLRDRIDLVASNSWISSWARLTMSSLLSNSYCIGLPGARLYGGCDYIDMETPSPGYVWERRSLRDAA